MAMTGEDRPEIFVEETGETIIQNALGDIRALPLFADRLRIIDSFEQALELERLYTLELMRDSDTDQRLAERGPDNEQ